MAITFLQSSHYSHFSSKSAPNIALSKPFEPFSFSAPVYLSHFVLLRYTLGRPCALGDFYGAHFS
ncbi:hypothetical protein EBX93_16355 [bacterium]|jgi:hypothetical protein|nr:hypothetical protein [bacterium]